LLRMGAEHLPRADFLEHVRQAVHRDGREGPWTQAVGRLPAQRLAGG
ncbi:TPA: leucyl/phenylalanyl-tRNA--protein transferase, partial [Stenotrophomonas maltophilia]